MSSLNVLSLIDAILAPAQDARRVLSIDQQHAALVAVASRRRRDDPRHAQTISRISWSVDLASAADGIPDHLVVVGVIGEGWKCSRTKI
jgi:hypothetical protein